jgi:hypothetical protein
MKSEDPEVIQLELKYCERCGALWLRISGAQEIYCAPCDLEVLDLPAPRKIATKPRLPGNHKIEAEARREDLSAIYGPGGQHDSHSLFEHHCGNAQEYRRCGWKPALLRCGRECGCISSAVRLHSHP